MSATNSPVTVTVSRKIQYISHPSAVSMADRWFEIASPDHFWVRRRFQVVQDLCGPIITNATEMAEIGCGHGLLQRQIEDAYNRTVMGFDLNEFALTQNLSRQSPVCCYDIFQKEPSLRAKFDLIFLFDVLEHISDEDSFLDALSYHLAPQGQVLINVPAGNWAFSPYDTAAGHVRRYSIEMLEQSARRCDFQVIDWTYWGLPLAPSLMVRKLWLIGKQDRDNIISSGFDTRSRWINRAMGSLAKLEWIPQRLVGTSLLAVLKRKSGETTSRAG